MNRRRFVLLPLGALVAGGAARGAPGARGAADVACSRAAASGSPARRSG
ncbi:MAG: hypothetical protein IPI73_16020 [Betaproteobacteria bacterium]|nr:hypothetical protein [Betaproteobacteria bacterium]